MATVRFGVTLHQDSPGPTKECWDSSTEQIILEAETSPFEIDAVNENDNRLVMIDLLNEGETLSILDVTFSRTAKSGSTEHEWVNTVVWINTTAR